jgi:putative peptide zinc metalloprotease protein
MTSVGSFLTARPRIRPDIVLGPAMVKGAKVVHNLKDRLTGRYFQVGIREHFLISRLDGERTLAEIGADYAEEFHRRLEEPQWQQLLGMLAQRRLLVGTDEPAAMAELADVTRKQSRSGQTLLKARLPLVDPDAFLGRMEPRLRFLFSRFFVLPVLAVASVIMLLTLINAVALFREIEQARDNPMVTGLIVAVYWLSLAAHEVAHGLTCKHYGGSAHEIGFMWRFPILAPYCDANDVVVLGNRWHRFYTAFAGVFTTMVLLIPFGLVWLLAPPDSDLSGFGAALLLFTSFGAVLNLIPVFQLDGYFMLNHALGMQNLRKHSYEFLFARLRGGRAAVLAYPRQLAWIYGSYGLASLLFGAAAGIALGWWLFTTLEPRLGTGPALVTILLAVFVVVAAALIARWQRRRKAGATS